MCSLLATLVSRVGNNGRSSDNVWPGWGFDQSNFCLTGHVDRLHLIILKETKVSVLLFTISMHLALYLRNFDIK